MKQAELKTSPSGSKEELCREIERLHSEVNQLALRLSACQGHEMHYIWTNLATARAHLATALEASRQLKNGAVVPITSDWEI